LRRAHSKIAQPDLPMQVQVQPRQQKTKSAAAPKCVLIKTKASAERQLKKLTSS
jgi:hypothetical protein